jgi:hypothetical protein
MPDSRDLAPISPNDGFGGSIANDRDLSAIPGNYFTAIADIEPRVETSEREDRWYGKVGEKTEIKYEARRAVAAGTSLLALKLHFLDDVLHSVVMAAHPEDSDRNPLSFMADEFFTLFVADPEAEDRREERIDELQAEMKSLRKQVSKRPDIAKPGLLPAPGQRAPSTTDLVRYQSKSQDIIARMDATISAAQEFEAEIKGKVALLQSNTTLLQRYVSERSDATLSSVADIITFGQEMKAGVKTISLYMGEDDKGSTVDVQTIATGAGAPVGEPLTLYQNLLYLDEELAIDLLDGGFDFTRLEDIGNILAADGTLIERMIPARRGAVLVRVRRDTKNYFLGDESFAAALRNAQLNMENMVTYLLVRDGENIHLVNSEVTTDLTQHLFPTRHEIDEIFRSHGRDIRPEHLEYSKVKNDFEKRTLYYKRILLMMWGLDHRLGLFGDFYDREAFEGWYDDRFHASRIVYVHDVENAIGEERPSFSDWVTSLNAMIQPGSRLLVDWEGIINERSSSFCFEERTNKDGERLQCYDPVTRFGTATVMTKDGRLVVKTEVHHRHPRAGRKRTMSNAYVDLAKGVTSYPPTAICLDEVTRSDIRYYLNSRKQRKGYLTYLHLFRLMDELLRKDEEREAPTMAKLRSDLSHSGVTGDRAERALTTAVGLWRATSGGPEIGRDGWTFRNGNQILDLAFALAGERGDLFERARRDIPDCVPIDLRVNGKGQFILYWKRPENIQPTFLAAFADVFVMRGVLRIRRDRVEINGEPTMTYAHNPGFASTAWSDGPKDFRHLVREISIARDDELLSRATAANLPGWVPADKASHIVDVVSYDAGKALEELDLEHTQNEISGRVLHVVVDKGNVNRTQVVIPLGIVQWSDHVSVIALECTGLDFLAALGEKSLSLAEELVRIRFKEKIENVADLQKRAAAAVEKGLVPMTLVTTRNWVALKPGINILNDGEVFGGYVATKGSYHSGFSGTLYETIEEAILKETQKSLRDAVRIQFLNEGSRKLAETYFNARKPT